MPKKPCIMIDEDMRVDLEPMNYVLKIRRVVKNGKNPGAVDWDTEGYFGRLSHLVMHISDLKFRESLSGAITISEAISRLGGFYAKTQAAIDKAIKGGHWEAGALSPEDIVQGMEDQADSEVDEEGE